MQRNLRGPLMAVCSGLALTLAVPITAGAKAPPAQVENPLATSDQTEAMARALRLMQTPEVAKGKEAATFIWKSAVINDPSPEAWASFDSAMEDWAYNYALKAANSDPNYPKVVHVYTPPRPWRGMNVPGSRWGGDNPDNIYRIIPIDAKARYRLDGRRIGKGPSDVTYTLVGNWETSKTLNGIEGRDVPVNGDGTFSITLDPSPANGRPNHIQTRPGAKLLFIRDSLGDWDQKANALTITRLDPPDAPPISDQEAAARAADTMVDGVFYGYYAVKMAHNTPNVFPPFFQASKAGGLTSQRNSTTQAQIADDEALVINIDPADAAYYSLVAQNYWFITVDYANRNSTLNNGQVTKNPDGTITYVASIRDPGVHNWIDTGGLHNPLLQFRLQGLPRPLPRDPWVKSQLVKLADLKSVLPAGTVWMSPAQRAAQIATRQRQIGARLADH